MFHLTDALPGRPAWGHGSEVRCSESQVLLPGTACSGPAARDGLRLTVLGPGPDSARAQVVPAGTLTVTTRPSGGVPQAVTQQHADRPGVTRPPAAAPFRVTQAGTGHSVTGRFNLKPEFKFKLGPGAQLVTPQLLQEPRHSMTELSVHQSGSIQCYTRYRPGRKRARAAR